MARIYNLEYHRSYDFICKFNSCKKVTVWRKNEGEQANEKDIAKILLEPFLKNLMRFSYSPGILLNEITGDECFRESLDYDYDKKSLYIDIIDEDDWDDNWEKTPSRMIVLKNLIKAIKDNEFIQKFVDLNKLSNEVLKELDRFSYMLYKEDYLKEVKSIRYYYTRLSDYNINSKILEELISQYDKFPRLSTVAFYYYLIDESDKFITLVKNKLDQVIMSSGFIQESNDFIYSYMNNKNMSYIENKVQGMINKKDITINNFKDLILNGIKHDIIEEASSNVLFNLLSISNMNGISFTDKIYEITEDREDILKDLNYYHPLKCKWERFNRYAPKSDIRMIEGVKFDFGLENHMIFEMKVIPKCYAPSVIYIVDISYSFKEIGRFLFLKDDIEEEVTKDELKNLPIMINKMEVYSFDIIKENWNN